MPRYFTAPSARIRFDSEGLPDDPVFIANVQVPEHIAADTGLLDASGETIWREPRPIGFGRMEEW